MKLSDCWATPTDLFNSIEKEFGPFDVDVCANMSNSKCNIYIDEQTDSLKQDWSKYGTTAWSNPPYSAPSPWIRKAKEETKNGVTTVMLLKADHSTKIYAECIYDYSTRKFYPGVERIDLPKRVRFVPPPGLINKKTGKPVKAGSPNYPSMLVIFRPT